MLNTRDSRGRPLSARQPRNWKRVWGAHGRKPMTDEVLGPITDPNNHAELFADGVTVAVRDGAARLIFLVERPRFTEAAEHEGSEARVVARIALTPSAARSMIEGLDRAFTAAMEAEKAQKPELPQ